MLASGPTASASQEKTRASLVVSIGSKGSLFLDGKPVSRPDLQARLSAMSRDPEVYLEADQRLPYGAVIEVMDSIRGLGFDRLALITQKP